MVQIPYGGYNRICIAYVYGSCFVVHLVLKESFGLSLGTHQGFVRLPEAAAGLGHWLRNLGPVTGDPRGSRQFVFKKSDSQLMIYVVFKP